MASRGSAATHRISRSQKFAQNLEWSAQMLHEYGLSQSIRTPGRPMRQLETVEPAQEQSSAEAQSSVAMPPSAAPQPAPAQPEQPAVPERCKLPRPSCKTQSGKSIFVSCPVCGSKFLPIKMKERKGHHYCPTCRAEMNEETFYRFSVVLEPGREQAGRIRERWWSIYNLLKSFDLGRNRVVKQVGNRVLQTVLTKTLEAGEPFHRIRKKQEELAQSCYYASEWYLLTGFPLDRFSCLQETIRPCFDTGRPELRLSYTGGQTSSACGVEAEWQVFQALNKARHDKSSPLYGAQLLPRILLPKKGNKQHCIECDLVLATRYNMYVLEVKSGINRVDIASVATHLVSLTQTNGKKVHNVFKQVEKQGNILASRLPKIPTTRIKKMLVYTDYDKQGAMDEFAAGRSVGVCNPGNAQFVRTIERAEQLSQQTESPCIPASLLERLYVSLTGRNNVRCVSALGSWGEDSG